MSNVSRRAFLRSVPAAAAAVAIASPALAAALPDTRPHDELVREKVAELKALMREAYPEADFVWLDAIGRTKECPLLISITARGPLDFERKGKPGKQA